LGKSKEDVPSVVRAVAGLQYGGHKIELFSRFQNFKPEWFDYWYERHVLTEGHVLRGALRIVNADEYRYYFKATRSVSRRRNYQKCPSSLGDNHLVALNLLREHGPLTPSEFTKLFNAEYSELGGGKRLLLDLYNHGEVARMGRKEEKPLYHAVEKLPYKLSMSRVPEDSATGAANGCLAGYLVKYRYSGTEKIGIRVEQGYEIGRPSLLLLRAEDKKGKIGIIVGGRVVMVAKERLSSSLILLESCPMLFEKTIAAVNMDCFSSDV